jgi:uncharacterized membrane protein
VEHEEDPIREDPKGSSAQRVEESEPVWTFRGLRLGSGEFTTAMVHFFRAEISRANVWRQRLDTTTNWAVVLTVAVISVAFSGPTGHHSVIILSTILITLFLFIEARRYRYYELWSSRVRLMETDFYAAMLVPPFHPDPDWAESLAETLLQPQFPITMWEAFGRRFRRNYMWIYVILALAWFAKIWFQPFVAHSWTQVLERARIGAIPGEVVLGLGVLFNGALFLIGVLTLGLQEASGEVLPRYFGPQDLKAAQAVAGENKLRPWFRRSSRRQQLMALIITDRGAEVADRILADMRRGVTSLPGKGMYTGKEHYVLMCALTVTEVKQLKALVKNVDPKAFLIVSPVREILGGGFAPLAQEEDSPKPR